MAKIKMLAAVVNRFGGQDFDVQLADGSRHKSAVRVCKEDGLTVIYGFDRFGCVRFEMKFSSSVPKSIIETAVAGAKAEALDRVLIDSAKGGR